MNEGSCSRYEFAAEIIRQIGYSERVTLALIALADYKRDSAVPPYPTA
ncbi:MAG: hypothetical protein U0074_01100 [Kouleothrix sp.]